MIRNTIANTFASPSVTITHPKEKEDMESLRINNSETERSRKTEKMDRFHLNRLQCFNDAVFAIVATILVLPIRKLEERDKTTSLEDQINNKWPQLLIYLVGFLVICAVWESHVLRFRILSRVDDFLVWFNLTSLLFTSFLPFTCALEGTFTKKYLSMMLICGDLLVLEFLEVLMIFYAFHHNYLLVDELKELAGKEIKQRMKYMFLKKVVNSVLYILAGFLSLLDLRIALVLMAIVVVSPYINRLMGVIYRKITEIHLTGSKFDRMFRNYIDKERIEFFSDGVYAIVSTLLVLDITSEDFPTKAEVARVGIQEALLEMKSELFTYGGTFVVVALLWFTHHSLFHYIEKLDQVMLVCNNLSLAFVGLSPLINVTLNRYAGHGNPDSRLAVQTGTVIVFMASLIQAVIFVNAVFKGPGFLDRAADPLESPRNHTYLACKLSVIPVMTFLVYLISLSKNYSVSDNVYHIIAGLTPVIFVLLKIAFMCWNRRHRLSEANLLYEPGLQSNEIVSEVDFVENG